MTKTFADLGIGPDLTAKLKQSGLTIPTPVQAQAIPNLLSGKDVIAQAQTGTGKTLAFVLPILEKINPELSCVQALIVTPTRELAIQITAEVKKLAPIVGASVLAAYGGQDVEAQIHKLGRQQGSPHIVVGTPGRILDHLRRETINLSRVTSLVLDEADQMLHIGFLAEVEEIIRHTPYKRQTMLFSATMSDSVRRLATEYMRSPIDIHIQGKKITLEGTKQYVIETSDRDKQDKLLGLIKVQQPFLAVVFCRTKVRAKTLTLALQDHGIDADELHGDLTQAKRENVMKRFRDAKLQVLVATDVAARGLDVEGVSHVYNYDIPHDVESYIHRIGRTGRAGQRGMAITFAAPRDRQFLQDIERGTNSTLDQIEAETGNIVVRGGGARSERNDRATGSGRRNERGDRGSRPARSDRGSKGGRSDARSGGSRSGRGFSSDTNKTSSRTERGQVISRTDDKSRGVGDLSVNSYGPSRPERGLQDSYKRRSDRDTAGSSGRRDATVSRVVRDGDTSESRVVRDATGYRGSRDAEGSRGGRDAAGLRGGRGAAGSRGGRDAASSRGGRDAAGARGARDVAGSRGSRDVTEFRGRRDDAESRIKRDTTETRSRGIAERPTSRVSGESRGPWSKAPSEASSDKKSNRRNSAYRETKRTGTTSSRDGRGGAPGRSKSTGGNRKGRS